MTAICLFGALCAVNQSVVLSNSDLDLFDPIISENDSTYNHVISPNESPCPSIFRYILETGEWHGEVTLENVDLQNDVNLRLEISIHKNLLSVSINSQPVEIRSEKCNLIYF